MSLKNLRTTVSRVAALEAEITLLKSRVDCAPGLFDELRTERNSTAYAERYSVGHTPLVSICVATYNRGDLLCERALKSLVQQTYQNIEIVVVGDGCTDDTERRVAAIPDSRIRFINLSERGIYPDEAYRRWCVAGTAPLNAALAIASGDFITHLDDDDEHSPDRIEKLVRHCQATGAEVVYHPFAFEARDGGWRINNAGTFAFGRVTTSSIFYDAFYRRIPWDIEAHLLNEPGDWNRLRKFIYLGAKIDRFPDVLLRHFRERSQSN